MDTLNIGFIHTANPCTDVRLHFAHGLMGGALRVESVAVRVEVGFPLRRDDLRGGLLNEAVLHLGNT